MSHYTIGELAKQSKVTIRTLQYYDRRGLLIAHRQTDSNRRYYTCLLYTSPSPRDRG